MRLSPEYERQGGYLASLDGLFDVALDNAGRVLQAGTTLEKTIQSAIKEGFGDAVAGSYIQEQIGFLRDLHSAYEIGIDDRFMDAVLSGNAHSPDEYPFQPIYDSLSSMEAQAANLSIEDRVMHIGTGWPGTAIGLYRQVRTPVTCVEIDPEVAARSREALARLGFTEDQLRVVTANGITLNTEGYKLVVVSAMVPTEDKMEIVQNMRSLAIGSLANDPLLILRTPPDHARELFYQPLPTELTNNSGLTFLRNTSDMMKPTDPLKSLVYKVNGKAHLMRHDDDGRRLEGTRGRLQPVR